MLMRAQIAAEMRYHSPWITDRNPPKPGYYLVSVFHGEPENFRSVRLDYWDGEKYPYQGGYATYEGWMEAPSPLTPPAILSV